ncbi:integrase arm-type DNA-binding domain-containing protein [Bradyrhizobium sp. AUGA SZCCT0158]|uniref:tyrosine-type recombinase/integrase n=1 Tax=Bradyrhizobium sp. AUGA SZCCT0158 TaxID=2807661 RepID=UPI001BAD6674|nr:site-specific integrase [Bradyrhizobium sp. AUGA SZCCT0158]MBR1200034.1 integrase arm-type DNA-binding domain-containing protein [Bradyrhizobium sp. AUGA SZCCT0158]
MPMHVLSDAAVAKIIAAKTPGRHADGKGLYLTIRPSGTASWSYKYRVGAKVTEVGLGGMDVTLDAARDAADALRKGRRDGMDPKAVRLAEKAAKTAGSDVPTFGDFMREQVALMTFKGGDDARTKWMRPLQIHAPALMPLKVDAITTPHVVAVLQPIWKSRAKTAREIRGRIKTLLDAAKVLKHRPDEQNPAAWSGHMEHLPQFKSADRKRKVRPLPAAKPEDVPAVVAEIRADPSPFDLTSEALEFTILTGVRTGSVRFMRMVEVDFDEAVWTVPGEALKVEDDSEDDGSFKVPLSPRALEILNKRRNYATKYVFRGIDGAGSALGMNALNHALARVRPGITVHGFRSSLRDWVGDYTNHPREIAEHVLGHRVGGAVERAYRRRDAFIKRRSLMNDWADYVTGTRSLGDFIAALTNR